MDSDVLTVKPKDNHRIYVELADGRRGLFDLVAGMTLLAGEPA